MTMASAPPPLSLLRSSRARPAAVAATLFALLATALVVVAATPARAADALLSQGKPATASSVQGRRYAARFAVDGNTSTRWSSTYSDPQWLQVDLGAVDTITSVTLNWETAYAKAFKVQTSTDGTTFSDIYSTTSGTGGVQTLTVTGSGRYVRMTGVTRATGYGYSLWEFQVYGTAGTGTAASPTPSSSATPSTGPSATASTGPTATASTGPSATATAGPSASATSSAPAGSCPAQSDTPDFGPNVHVFDTSMSNATIQAQLDADFNAQKDTQSAQFTTRRVAHLFKPGTYGVSDNVGYYTSVAGLGQNPDDVTINNATVDAFNASDAGNATQNFWRSAENLSISGSDRWAVAQAGPFRRIDVHGDLDLFPASYYWASGGYVSDTKVSGKVSSASQQQWYSKDSSFGSWDGSVWNMVFSGVSGAPAQSFPSPPYTTLATTPVSRDVPYLYFTDGKYRVFLPSLRTNSSGPSWANGSTPGTSLPMSQFYVVKSGDTAATINTALANGCNLFFTPGVYHVDQTLNVTRPDTVVLGIGFPTIIPDNGVTALQVADVSGVRLKGLLFSAGTTNSPSLVTVGSTAGAGTDRAADPVSVQDVFFRVGGDQAGKATQSLVVNSSNTLIDHIWAWRADHGTGVGWTVNTADTGLTVNGNNVLATGLFVEHYQKYEVVWNGQGGKTIFFQNEMPYDVPNQAAWMNGTIKGYAAYKVADTVTTHEAWGLGSYCYFSADPTVSSYHAFEVPNTPGVKMHDLLTVSLGNNGSITHVINDTGAQTPTDSTSTTVTNYP